MIRLLLSLFLLLSSELVLASLPLKTYDLIEILSKQNSRDTLFLSPGYYQIARTDSLVSNLSLKIKGVGRSDSIIIIVDGPKGIILNEGADWYFENLTFRNSRTSTHDYVKMEYLTIRNSKPIFKNCVFHRIESMYSGYVIRIEGNSAAPVFDGVIIRSANLMQGAEAPIQLLGGKTTFNYSTIGFNYAPVCEGIQVFDGDVRFINSVLAGNELTTKSRLPVLLIHGTGTVFFTNSVFLSSTAEPTEQSVYLKADSWSNLKAIHPIFRVIELNEPEKFWKNFSREINLSPVQSRKPDQIGAIPHQFPWNSGPEWWQVLSGLSLILIPASYGVGLYRKKKLTAGKLPEPTTVSSQQTTIHLSPNLIISVNGLDFSSTFSQDQLHFLDFMIRHSLVPQTPVNLDSVFLSLWPEESYRLEKNNRNVFLHRFREKLALVPGLQLEMTSPKYFLLSSQDFVKILP